MATKRSWLTFLPIGGTAADSLKLGGVLAASFQQKTAALSPGASWTIEQSGSELVFKYSGVTKAKLTSAGTLLAVTDVGKGVM